METKTLPCSGGHYHHLSHTGQAGTPSFCRERSVPCPQAAPCKKDCNSCLDNPPGACVLSQNRLPGPRECIGWRGSPLLCSASFFSLGPTLHPGPQGPLSDSHPHPREAPAQRRPTVTPALLRWPQAPHLLPLPQHSPFRALSLLCTCSPATWDALPGSLPAPSRSPHQTGWPRNGECHTVGPRSQRGGPAGEGRRKRGAPAPAFLSLPQADEPQPARAQSRCPRPASSRASHPGNSAEAAGSTPGTESGWRVVGWGRGPGRALTWAERRRPL